MWRHSDVQEDVSTGILQSCMHCASARGTDIMDHQTKGDEPFQEIVSSQLLEQPPRQDVDYTTQRSKVAYLFRWTSICLEVGWESCNNIQLRDAVRPLFLDGLTKLEDSIQEFSNFR